jgi:hypothetical protein
MESQGRSMGGVAGGRAKENWMGIGHGGRFRRRWTRDALVEANEAGRLRRLRRHPRPEKATCCRPTGLSDWDPPPAAGRLRGRLLAPHRPNASADRGRPERRGCERVQRW